MNLKMLVRLVTITALAALALGACRFPGSDGGGEDSSLLFEDDFTNPGTGWNRVKEETGETDYANGVYRILVNAPNTDLWASPGRDFTDVRIEVDTIRVGGDLNNRYGIICRVTDRTSFYIFLISTDGYYGIGKIRGDQYELIGMNALQPTDKVLEAGNNHLRADCVGDRLSLYVNGDKLAEVQDNELATGDAGLIAGAYGVAGTDIYFDNFSVLKP
jgi:hypothetical protein